MPEAGYYSLVQYCPNPLRMECANLGVALFVPSLNFIEVIVNSSNDHVRNFFGRSFNNYWLNAAKESMKDRIETSHFENIESFEYFVKTRMNEIQLTPPKLIRVEDSPEKILKDLFKKLAEHKRKKKSSDPIIEELDDAFRSPDLHDRIKFDIPFEIPQLKRKIKIPYAFQNGTFNLVKPALFNQNNNFQQGSTLAMDGRLINRFLEDTRLIVIPEVQGKTKKDKDDIITTLDVIFKEANIRTIWENERPSFIEEVKQLAH